MTMEFLTRELRGGFAMGNGAHINGVAARLLLAVLVIAFLFGGSLGSRRGRRLLQRSISLLSLKGLNAERICVPRVPAFMRKCIQSLARICVLQGLLRNFLRAACLHLAALPRSLLTSFSSLATEFRRGSNHLTTSNNLIVGDMKILFFYLIGFHFIRGANAQDQTDNGKPVDPEAWKTSDNTKAAAMFLLASSIGGVGVAVWILYNRRNTFSLDDIDEGLMRGPAVVRRDDPTFELLPSIETMV